MSCIVIENLALNQDAHGKVLSCSCMDTLRNDPYILYADDDIDDRMLIAELLKELHSGIDLRQYQNGKLAFEYLQSMPAGARLPSVIILDLNMPEWGGLDTLTALKQNKAYAEVPVVIFTTSDYEKHRDLSFSKGADDFITKPHRVEKLDEVCLKFASFLKYPPLHK